MWQTIKKGGVRKIQRKTKVAIVILMLATAIILTITALVFWVNPVSSLGKYIQVCVFCQETEEPIPAGLAVTVEGQGYKGTLYTNEKGCTGRFGSGLVDGNYAIQFYWNEPYSYDVTINCSKIVWSFNYHVPNPVIIKHFYYDLKCDDGSYPPVVGLNVSLVENSIPIAWQLTDAKGTVMFDGHYVDVCKEYQLAWTWGGIGAIEPTPTIHFGYEDGKLLECLWEHTNYLEPKSDGDLTTLG